MHISEWVFKKKAIYHFLLLCVIVGGVLSFDALSKLEDPEIVIMQAQVVTAYPGASAHEVEMRVTDVLENELSSLADIQQIASKSVANVSLVTVELKMTVPQDEIQKRWEFMRRKISKAKAQFPDGVMDPLVIDDMGDVYGMFYAMTGDGYSYTEMADYADWIKRQMVAIDGVSRVQVFGVQHPTVDIVLSNEKMGELGVFPVQIISALQSHGKTVYAGSLQMGEQNLRMNVSHGIASVNDVENLRIKGLDGKVFRLGDIAKVEKGFSRPLKNTMHLNGEKALGISISMESGENIVKVGERVEERMLELMPSVPQGIEFEKVFFQPDKVRASVKGFMVNLVSSVLIVIFVLMLTMGLRSGIIIGTGLLLTILGTFPLLLATDGSLQRISLGAFIVAMGMLVDNAIVVLDGILVDLQNGKNRKKAFVDSAKRTAIPLLGATLIAVSAFLPVFISQDTAGVYARDLFIVLCFSLLISWILAITQVPLSSERFLKVSKKKIDKNPYDGKVFHVLKVSLAYLMKYRYLTLVISALALAIAAYNFKNVKQTFFPDFNYNQVYIEYKLPDGTHPDKVNNDLQQITRDFLKHEEVNMVVASQGMTPTRYCLVRAMGEMSDSYGELIVNFDDYETMIKMKPILEKYLTDNYPDAYTRIRKYNLSIKSTHMVEAEFSGPDPAVLKDLSQQAEKIMVDNPYVDKRTVCNDWEPMAKTLMAQYNSAAAVRNGTNRSDVSNALLAAGDGLPLGMYYEGEHAIALNLKVRNNTGGRISDMNQIPVWNMLPNVSAVGQEELKGVITGITSIDDVQRKLVSPVPITAVTHGVQLDWEEPVVRRVNGQRTIQAQCDPLDGYSPALVRNSILKEIEAIPLPEGYAMKWMGEYELQGTALRNIFSFLPIAIMLIVLILIMLFNDFKRPIIVILTIPMAVVGIVPGLIVTGMPFTFIAIIGSLGLMGMLIKNAIVLLDEISKQREEGKTPYQAILDATVMRTRPVLMASFTTILGMIPLFFDPMYASMAAAVISGLLVGTVITLIFIPVLYAVFYGIRRPNNVETF